MYAIARHRVGDLIRQRQRHPCLSLEGEDIDVCADRGGAPAAVMAAEEQDAVRRALTTLTPRRREALVLRFYHGERYAAVAQALSVPLGTAGTLVHYGLADLRASLGGRLGRSA